MLFTMLHCYCILLITFLRFTSTDNVTNPICESLTDNLDFSEITENSYFNALVQVGSEIQEIQKEELLQAASEQCVGQFENLQSSAFCEPPLESYDKASKISNGISTSNRAMPSTSRSNRESCIKETRKFHCEFKSCRASLRVMKVFVANCPGEGGIFYPCRPATPLCRYQPSVPTGNQTVPNLRCNKSFIFRTG